MQPQPYTLHIISHTHWDREWYLTFQQFRLKLVHMVDGLLDLLDSDPNFHSFMLDGQAIVLDDYLHMRPERRPHLLRHIQAGRISIGPWFVLPDEFLVSPEAILRNFLQGRRTCAEFGPPMPVGYIPDPFGHIGQMPQILNGFGIHSASVQRGLSDEPCEFWWQAPDGSRVFMAYLRDGYGNAADLPAADPQKFAAEVGRLRDSLAPYAASRHLLLMWGTDHTEPSPLTSSAIASAAGKLGGDVLVHSTLPEYLAAAQADLDLSRLPVVVGELRSPRRSPLLPNVLSSRMWIKQRNHACESLLERWAEPFSTLASLQCGVSLPPGTVRHPAPILRQAWRLLLENHAHDSICGCSIDQVHAEMRPRFDQVEQIGEEITRQSLEALAGAVNTLPQPLPGRERRNNLEGALASIVAFNPSDTSRSDAVQVELELPAQAGSFELHDETGAALPYQMLGSGSRELIHMTLGRDEFKRMSAMVSEGRITNLVLRQFSLERRGSTAFIELGLSDRGEPDLDVWHRGLEAVGASLDDASITSYEVHARSAATTRLLFLARDVPAHGHKTFWVVGSPAKESAPVRLNPLLGAVMPLAGRLAQVPLVQKLAAPLLRDAADRPPYRIENEFFVVAAAADGTLDLYDRHSGAAYRGLNRFVDGADCGDEYNYSPPAADRLLVARRKSVRIERSPLRYVLEIALELRLPVSLTSDRKGRAAQHVRMPLTTRLTLTSGVPRVDIHTEIDNTARDHRLRVHFPAPFQVTEALHDGHFEIVCRPVGVPLTGADWVERPCPQVPQRAFTQIADSRLGLLLAAPGLPEVEVLQAGSTSEIALTLLRCVGWLSRDDYYSRNGHAGPFLETPGAQVPGRWSFDYAVIPFAAPEEARARQQAYAFAAPLRAVAAPLHSGNLASRGSFLQVDPPEFRLTAIKESEDGRALVVRGYNLGASPLRVTLRPWKPFPHASRANLAEEPQSHLTPAADGSVSFEVKGHEIASVLFATHTKP